MPKTPPCELIGWKEFERLARKLALQIRADEFKPDIIVAIGRGGYLPARIVSDSLDLMALASFRIEHYAGAHKRRQARVKYPLAVDVSGMRVLLMDDVSDSGDTFDVAIRHIRERSTPRDLRTAVLHHKTTSRYEPDYYAHRIVKWRWLVYPWALVEDVGGFVRAMKPVPKTPREIARRLAREHGLRLSQQDLAAVLAAMD